MTLHDFSVKAIYKTSALASFHRRFPVIWIDFFVNEDSMDPDGPVLTNSFWKNIIDFGGFFSSHFLEVFITPKLNLGNSEDSRQEEKFAVNVCKSFLAFLAGFFFVMKHIVNFTF